MYLLHTRQGIQLDLSIKYDSAIRIKGGRSLALHTAARTFFEQCIYNVPDYRQGWQLKRGPMGDWRGSPQSLTNYVLLHLPSSIRNGIYVANISYAAVVNKVHIILTREHMAPNKIISAVTIHICRHGYSPIHVCNSI